MLPELFCVFWIADDDDIVSIFFGGTCIREAMVLCWIQKSEVGNVTIECMAYNERKK